VFAAAVIEQMERANGGRPACEIFDCFTGTSAGSFLAAGLAAGKTAAELKQVFIQLGQAMSVMMGGGAGPDSRAKATRALEQVLQQVLGPDTRASQLRKRFAVPARNMALGKVVFFGNFPPDQLEETSFWDDTVNETEDPVWMMVRRSAALPPLFEPEGPYLDGGVSPFANPCYAIYEGVQRRLGWNPYEEPIRFYSVGTGYFGGGIGQDPGRLDDTALYATMADVMMQDINFLQHQVMKQLRQQGTIWYKRYNVRFDETGFRRWGLDTTGRDFRALAATATPLVEELAAIGTAVGRQAVLERDFRNLTPRGNRRARRVMSQVRVHPARPDEEHPRD